MLSPDRLTLPAELQADCTEAGDLVRVLRTWHKQKPLRVPFAIVARMAGIDPGTMRQIVKTGFVRRDTARKLTPIVREIEAGKLRFRRQGWQAMRYDADQSIIRTPTRRPATAKEAENRTATRQIQPAPGARDTTQG